MGRLSAVAQGIASADLTFKLLTGEVQRRLGVAGSLPYNVRQY